LHNAAVAHVVALLEKDTNAPAKGNPRSTGSNRRRRPNAKLAPKKRR
jgi:hypothetical protein